MFGLVGSDHNRLLEFLHINFSSVVVKSQVKVNLRGDKCSMLAVAPKGG